MNQLGSNIELLKFNAEYLIDKKGNYLNFYINDMYEFRLESEENAKNLGESFGVFIETGIDINSPLPDEIFSKGIQTITYEVIGDAKKKINQKDEKILSDTCEALIGAIYTDRGYNYVKEFVLRLCKTVPLGRKP